jgi:hypothetical protein
MTMMNIYINNGKIAPQRPQNHHKNPNKHNAHNSLDYMPESLSRMIILLPISSTP